MGDAIIAFQWRMWNGKYEKRVSLPVVCLCLALRQLVVTHLKCACACVHACVRVQSQGGGNRFSGRETRKTISLHAELSFGLNTN